jgi:hypothetical protein
MIAKIDGHRFAIFHEQGHRGPGVRQPADVNVKSELA